MLSETQNHKYSMTIGLNVLNHLGIGLYSNVPAVLSEAVANSWDADAEKVEIEIHPGIGEIIIQDDGVGMTTDEVNAKFLFVGYDKRENEPSFTPEHNRPVMGRKGIGKLALFSIADVVKVCTVKGGEVSCLEMDAGAIKTQIKSGTNTYHPKPIPPEGIDFERGTRIVLQKLKKGLTTTETFLRRRLARRFSVIGTKYEFEVSIDGKHITAKDRAFLPSVEFLWYLGDESRSFLAECKNVKKSVNFDNVVDAEKGYKVRGWVATAKDQKSIDEQNNTIVIFARGKLIQEDILRDFKEGGLFSKYLIGEIDADFMDLDDQDDLVTSDRQSVKEYDPRYEALKDYVWGLLKDIQKQWTNLRTDASAEKALENPVIAEWYKRLTGDHKKTAQKLFARIESLPGIDSEARLELYRSSLLAFEKLALKNTLSALDLLETERDFALVKTLFDSIDEIEAAHYHQIVKGRLEVIHRLQVLVDSAPAVKERVLQEHIFDHLWLLSPSWERASSNQRIEEAVTKEFDAVTAALSDEEKKGRIDIRYKTAAGKHVIVELKKYDRSVDIYELLKQIDKYIRALNKCLKTHFPEQSRVIETVIILGSPPRPRDGEQRSIKLLKEYNARYLTYDTLIAEAIDSYEQYLEADKRISEIVDIIERL